MDNLTWIDTQRERMISLVVHWASINSYTHNLEGLAQLRGELVKEFSVLGGEMREVDLGPRWVINSRGEKEAKAVGKAISIRKRPDVKQRAFLCIHMDTVYPPENGFNQITRVDENVMRGPGVTDAKGGLAVMLVALQAFEQSPLAERVGWEVLINPDEEVGSSGSRGLFEEAAKRNDVGLLFEPALPDGSLVADRKGSGNYTIIVRGRAAHAGRAVRDGRNAIVAMAQLIVKLQELKLPNVTMNVGHIEGGGPVNIVPDLAIMRMNFRFTGDASPLRVYLKKLIAEINSREGFSATLEGGISAPAKPRDPAMEKLIGRMDECARGLGIAPLSWKQSGGVSDGNRLAAFGLPNIDTLGPRGGEIHSPKEFLELDSLTEKAKLTTAFLMKFAQNGV